MKIKPLNLKKVSYFYLELVQNLLILFIFFGIVGFLNDKFLLLFTSYNTIHELFQADRAFQILFDIQFIGELIFFIALYRNVFPLQGGLKMTLKKISDQFLKILLIAAVIFFILPFLYLFIF